MFGVIPSPAGIAFRFYFCLREGHLIQNENKAIQPILSTYTKTKQTEKTIFWQLFNQNTYFGGKKILLIWGN